MIQFQQKDRVYLTSLLSYPVGMSAENSEYRIFVDQPDLSNVVLDFPNYIETLTEIILNSTPRYTIGIFGEWGTGKTTLMESIQKQLEKKGINCLSFNAWRYEGEPRSATYPLMLSILGNLITNDDVKAALREQKAIQESIKDRVRRVLKGLSGSVTFGIPDVVSGTLNVTPSEMMADSPKQQLQDIEDFYDENKPPLQEGVELIQQELLGRVNGPQSNEKLKLVVFIDDLDRCTPEKATQVLESIKVFFDIIGIVFVLGLSRSVVEAAINQKYKDFEKGTFNGGDYLKKIIQVPFALPAWTDEDLEKFIEALLGVDEKSPHRNFFIEKKGIIAQAVQANPREVKRLLNSFILARKIFVKQINSKKLQIDDEKLLVIQAIVLRWKWFFDYIVEIKKTSKSSHAGTLLKIKYEIADPTTRDKMPEFANIVKARGNQPMPTQDSSITTKIKAESDLYKFLKDKGSIIFNLSDAEFETYRRATAVDVDLSFNDKSPDTGEKIWRKIYRDLTSLEELISKKIVEYGRIFEVERTRNPFVLSHSTETKAKLAKIETEIEELLPKFAEKSREASEFEPRVANDTVRRMMEKIEHSRMSRRTKYFLDDLLYGLEYNQARK